MMRINFANLRHALRHPCKTARYIRHRDRISYEEIAPFVPPDPVILEAGVANGVNTEEMALFWKGASIHGFEPVPAARELASARTAPLGDRVVIYPYALGDAASKLTMNVSGGGEAVETQSSSLLKPTGHLEEYEFVPFGETIEVDVVRLDEWATEADVTRVDFMWLDLQGYELIALKGAEHLLREVSAIHVEVSHKDLFEGGVLYPELRDWLGERGFLPRIDATFRLGGNVLFARQ